MNFKCILYSLAFLNKPELNCLLTAKIVPSVMSTQLYFKRFNLV